MSFDFDSLDELDSFDSLDTTAEVPKVVQYPDQLKIKELSYSSLLTMHGCPRRFQLDKTMNEQPERKGSVTFAYGHAVGEGIQQALQNKSEDEILWSMFLAWDTDLLDEWKNKKSFAYAWLAVQKFLAYKELSDLADYEVATIGDRYACELSFRITLVDGYVYRGYIDVVLVHKVTGELLVLELKTAGNNVHEAQYKNSAQALSYTIVLDTMQGSSSNVSFDVRYLVYKTSQQEYEPFNFTKLFNKKVEWIQDILADCDTISRYAEEGHFPKRGEHCYSFFSVCPHFDYCHLKDSSIRINMEATSTDTEEYQLNYNLLDIIAVMEK